MYKRQSLGRRIETRDGARATVRYVGSVDGQDGEWVGVEWDDPARGKHDGSHDGKRYFECAATGLEPGALPASFVRAHKIRPSVTFAAAIRAKYLDGKGEIAKVPKTPGADADADADAGEAYVQSSNGQKIEIELCLKKDDPVAALAALDRVYLPDAAVATAGAPGEAAACGVVATRVRLMDLSGNLMRDWPAVARFGEEFPNLAELNLNHVRLDWGSARVVSSVPRAVCEAGENKAPFANLRVLSLNGSGCGWASARAIAAATPSLRELSLARCGVRSLGGADASTSGLEALEALNLEGNCLAEWSEVETLAPLPSLARLHLGGNRLRRVRYPSRSHSDGAAPFASLTLLEPAAGADPLIALLGEKRAVLLSTDGAIVATTELPAWPVAPPTVADFDGDGIADLVVPTRSGHVGLRLEPSAASLVVQIVFGVAAVGVAVTAYLRHAERVEDDTKRA